MRFIQLYVPILNIVFKMSRQKKMQKSNFHRRTQATMAKRPTKVVPVGAWVELGPTCGGEFDSRHQAIISAHEEEEKIRECQLRKQAKLERFRQDVRHRVHRLHQQKRNQQLRESFQAAEVERNVIEQSSHAVERATTKKNYCLYRNTDLSIKHSEGMLSSDTESEKEEKNAEYLQEKSHQIYRTVRSAKHNLAAKQLIPRKSAVPGGPWGQSFTRDKQDYPLNTFTAQHLTDASTESDLRISQQPIDDISSYGESKVAQRPGQLSSAESVLRTGGMSPPKTVTVNPIIGQEFTNAVPSGQHVQHIQSGVPDTSDRSKKVTFGTVDKDVWREIGWEKVTATKCRPQTKSKKRTVPDLMSGVQKEEHKRQIQSQYSMYRRLFMDIEREQVRENIRKKEHQRKIERLKKQKEQERQDVENQICNAMEARHPLTGETEMEALEREMYEEQCVEEMVRKQKQQQQKHKETTRYIRALRAMMKEKMDQQGVTLPPLCACGPTVWDSNPDMCANNCVFYKNPKAYAKALSSLLMSCYIE